MINLVGNNLRLEIEEIFISNAATEEATASSITEVLKAEKLVHLRIAQSSYPLLAPDHMGEDEEYPYYSAVFCKKVKDACSKIRFSGRIVRVRVFGIDYL